MPLRKKTALFLAGTAATVMLVTTPNHTAHAGTADAIKNIFQSSSTTQASGSISFGLSDLKKIKIPGFGKKEKASEENIPEIKRKVPGKDKSVMGAGDTKSVIHSNMDKDIEQDKGLTGFTLPKSLTNLFKAKNNIDDQEESVGMR